MLEFIAGVEGFRTGRRVEAGLDQTGWANGHVRSIQDVGNLARAGGVGEDGRSESDRDGAEINTFFQLPGQRGPHDRTIRNVTPSRPGRTGRRQQTQNPRRDEHPESVPGHRSRPGHAEIAPVLFVKKHKGVDSIV